MESSRKAPKTKGGWNSAIFIIFVELAERFAYYGLVGNLITYLTNDLGEATATAAKSINTWIGVSSIFPLLGAYIADTYIGRFTTILVASFVYLGGMVLLTLSVSVVPKRHREAVFFTALYVLAAGQGGHKPCVQTFAADQFDEESPEEKAAKSSFFNWWYLGIVLGATSAVLGVVYIQDEVGWTQGYGILAGAVAVSLVLFLLGTTRYKKQGHLGSPITRMLQVFVAAVRKWRLHDTHHHLGICNTEDGGRLVPNLARTNTLRFLDKAMMIDSEDATNKKRDPWRLCSQNQVEEVKLVVRLTPIWLTCIMFAVVQSLINTYFTKQGSSLVRNLGPNFQLPPASLQGFVGLTLLVAIPMYDRLFVPMARRITGHPSGITILQRIGFGLFLSVFTMVVAGLVETKRIHIARDHGLIDNPKATVPMSFWWLFPQYMLFGVTDVFTIVGMQELFYDQMPEGMRSIGAALYVCVVGAGSFLSSGIISATQAISSATGGTWLDNNLNKAHLNYYYWVVAAMNALNLCVYIWIASGFVYKKIEHGDHGASNKDNEMVNMEEHGDNYRDNP